MNCIVALALVGLAQAATLETYSGSTICVQNEMDLAKPIYWQLGTETDSQWKIYNVYNGRPICVKLDSNEGDVYTIAIEAPGICHLAYPDEVVQEPSTTKPTTIAIVAYADCTFNYSHYRWDVTSPNEVKK